MRTEKDIGSKNPETTAVSGFRYAFFRSEIQKISFPPNDLWGGLELNTWAFKGRFCVNFRGVCPFLVFLIVMYLQISRVLIIINLIKLCNLRQVMVAQNIKRRKLSFG